MNDPVDRLNAALDGRYRIERELGEGGMATVFLAEDLKHKRRVALKVLKPELAAVVGGERFLAEIETTANLTHPNILPLFDSGEADSFLYYVMPYVEGESLRDRLDREKQLGVDDAVRLATEVAEALEHAHNQGVVHRDVKPANILLQDGRPLVSDFGIALAVSQAGGGRLTETGLSMGTPHYMSPEQASGDRDVDPRTDVYSLGCVLFEMLTGEPPYGGGTAQAVLARILTGVPDRPTQIRSTIPRHVEAVILKAMEKLPADRFESTADLARALGDSSFRYGAETAETGASAGWWKAGALATGAVAVLLALALVWATSGTQAPPPTTRSVFSMPVGHGVLDQLYHVASFTPDGAALVYLGSGASGPPQLHVKERSSVMSRTLPGTAGAEHPEVDPTGEWVAFIANGELRKMPLAGGPSIVLDADSVVTDVGSVAWLDDGTVAYTAAGFSIRRVPEEGGSSELLYAPAEEGNVSLALSALPGGKLLFVQCISLCQASADLTALDPATGELTVLQPSVTAAWYVDPGYLVMVRPDGSVFGVRFDAGTLTLDGEPIPLFEGVQIDQGIVPDMEVGRSGQVLARIGGESTQERSFFWVDRSGARTAVDADFVYHTVTWISWRLSPDGRFVAFDRTTDAGTDIWVKELDAGPVYRLTFDETQEFRPEWSPDGEHIMFVSERQANRDLFRRRANGTGPVEEVLDRPTEISQGTWSPDGEWLVYREGTAQGRDIWAFRPATDSVPQPLIADPGYDEKSPRISPDGRWIAYESDETGSDEVYIRPFPDVEENRWQISVGGGRHHLWSPDGRELFYVRSDDSVVVATLNPGPPFSVGTRRTLFSVGGVLTTAQDHSSWDIHPDGERFLLSIPAATPETGEVYWLMIDHWAEELEARLGGAR